MIKLRYCQHTPFLVASLIATGSTLFSIHDFRVAMPYTGIATCLLMSAILLFMTTVTWALAAFLASFITSGRTSTLKPALIFVVSGSRINAWTAFAALFWARPLTVVWRCFVTFKRHQMLGYGKKQEHCYSYQRISVGLPVNRKTAKHFSG